ncbi:MAG: hypothetical protein ACRDPO_31580, partial [Streptosporangiaceae bacterium]
MSTDQPVQPDQPDQGDGRPADEHGGDERRGDGRAAESVHSSAAPDGGESHPPSTSTSTSTNPSSGPRRTAQAERPRMPPVRLAPREELAAAARV